MTDGTRRDHRLILTDDVSAIEPGADWYGLLVSQLVYDALEYRAAAVAGEVPIANKFPVAVDRRLAGAAYRKVRREEWDQVTRRI